MRETAKVLNGILFAVTPWLVLVGMLMFLIPGPVQRWGTASLERFERLRADSGLHRAAPLLTQILLLPPRIRDRVGGHGLAPGYVVRWWRARPLAGPFKIIRFVLLLYVVGHIDDLADWEHLRLSADPGPQPGVVQALLSSFVAMPMSVVTWDFSVISRGTEVLIWALILIAEVRLLKRVNLTSSGKGATLAAYDLEGLTGSADGDSARMEDRRCWPVVALLTVAAQCAAVLRRWEETSRTARSRASPCSRSSASSGGPTAPVAPEPDDTTNGSSKPMLPWWWARCDKPKHDRTPSRAPLWRTSP